MKAVGVIPARWGASRFPGKLLAPLAGKPVLQHVWERASRASTLEKAVVATDDDRIRRAAGAFGAEVVMTSSGCRTGTERVAEAAERLSADVLVNVQGDEPFILPGMIDTAVEALEGASWAEVSTLARPCGSGEELERPDTVKVVVGREGSALYFSRSPIPYPGRGGGGGLVHIGLYCYRREFLRVLARLEPTPLETVEKLEQLRVLESGYKIKVAMVAGGTIGIDTPADLERARAMIGD
ncbi:MAG TPA: 3-deoxy-manno-octulosonate cytidylyltransferase [bacterium]|nr:3-deoxy-manno-octulosonate cytidylyltransferase [bacterium]HPQ67096.1 3-deoxy-manno-octulosonate cytidylyltransferase [bacterium]